MQFSSRGNGQPGDYADLLDPQALARIGHLELLSTRVVDGFLSGKHRSTHKGGCFEFAEHRAYTAGDEIRLIDWRVYARSDRYYIKQFEEETNLQAIMLVDTSGSMSFGLSTVAKLDYARMACACLSRLVLRQRDAVGLSVFASDRHRRFRTQAAKNVLSSADDGKAQQQAGAPPGGWSGNAGLQQYIPPRANALHLQAVLTGLRRVRAEGASSLAENLNSVVSRLTRRGLVVMFSDCFGPLEAFAKALHQLRLRGHEALLFHIMAPEELAFSFSKWSRFECLEVNGLTLDVDPPSVRRRYLDRVNHFLSELKQSCTKFGCDYMPVSTDRPLHEVLAHYLGRRLAQRNRAGRA